MRKEAKVGGYIDILDMPPEQIIPDGVDAYLVGIIRHGEYNHYVLPRIMLYLDYRKYLLEAFPGCVPEQLRCTDIADRFNIYTVDQDHEEQYLQCLKPYKRSCERLREEIQLCLNPVELGRYTTEVIIDFDKKYLRSCDLQGKLFLECFLPDGWNGEYKWFNDLEEIPPEKRYWIEDDGRNLFMELFKEEKDER